MSAGTPLARSAVHPLEHKLTVDPARVFVLGHSIGARSAPRGAAAEASVADLVGRMSRSASTAQTTTRFPGADPSTPAEYKSAQHVDPAVVADIAAWLTR